MKNWTEGELSREQERLGDAIQATIAVSTLFDHLRVSEFKAMMCEIRAAIRKNMPTWAFEGK